MNEVTPMSVPERHEHGDHCDHASKPVAPTAGAATRTVYTCPTHPQIRRSEPGNCPICGMTLEPGARSGANRRRIKNQRESTALFVVIEFRPR